MRLGKKARSVFLKYRGHKAVSTLEDLEDIIEDWHEGHLPGDTIFEATGLTEEQYALFVEDQYVFLEYVNRNLHPVEIYSLADFEKLGPHWLSPEVESLRSTFEKDPLMSRQLFPTNLILIRGKWEIL